MSEKVIMLEKPVLHEPVLVVGLPGSGLVGKLAVDHLISLFGGKLFAEIYSYRFPPYLVIKQDGSSRLLRNELYYLHVNDINQDLIVLTGDAQPSDPVGQYALSDRALDIAESYDAKLVVSLAAYITYSLSSPPISVYGVTTHSELVPKLQQIGVKVMDEGNISGMNGLVLGLAKLRNMKGVCFLGETSGYVVDPMAAGATLEALGRFLGFTIDVKSLQEKQKEVSEFVKSLREFQRRVEEERAKAGEQAKDLGYIS
ncbi:MAG: proteasome assembly chaperone family protein [Nitrososphaerota archaeon]